MGFVNPKKMLTKGGVKPGDALVLTKPLGFGVTTTALKQEKATPEDVAEVVGWMKNLNKDAGALAVEFGLRGGTDVTGFSLLGHGWKWRQASGVGYPVLRGEDRHLFRALVNMPKCGPSLAAHRIIGATSGRSVRFAADDFRGNQMLLFDPQTSGGLLLAVPPEKADGLPEPCRRDQTAGLGNRESGRRRGN